MTNAYKPPSTRRRFAARSIDLLLVFAGFLFLFWSGGFSYHVVAGCLPSSQDPGCQDSTAGGYAAILVFSLAFVFPLVYECATRRTLGKKLLSLEILDRNHRVARRLTRLNRAFAAWVPVLVLAAGTGEASGGLSTLFGTLWLLYGIVLAGTVLARVTTPHDWVAGTEVVQVTSNVPVVEEEDDRPLAAPLRRRNKIALTRRHRA